jgi:osmotically-inducible protein OsmY
MRNALVLSLLLGAGLVVAGCATERTARPPTAGEYLDDSAITAAVNGAIVKDPDAHFFKIDVTTTQGDVVLQGFVNNRETESRLVARTRELKGVRSVKSLLRVDGQN